MKSVSPATALKHVYHAVYLQLLLGGAAFFLPHFGGREVLSSLSSAFAGALLVGSAINVLSYLARYKKSLSRAADDADAT
jgi:hypothetical protein